MRSIRIVVLLAAVLAGSAAFAQDGASPATAPKPDYSRDTLMRLLVDIEAPEHQPAVRFRLGAIEFNALGTQWRFNYLPLMMPLSGSQARVTREWPDPFALTGTAIAVPPRIWRERRAIERELRRINRTAKVKVEVRTE